MATGESASFSRDNPTEASSASILACSLRCSASARRPSLASCLSPRCLWLALRRARLQKVRGRKVRGEQVQPRAPNSTSTATTLVLVIATKAACCSQHAGLCVFWQLDALCTLVEATKTLLVLVILQDLCRLGTSITQSVQLPAHTSAGSSQEKQNG